MPPKPVAKPAPSAKPAAKPAATVAAKAGKAPAAAPAKKLAPPPEDVQQVDTGEEGAPVTLETIDDMWSQTEAKEGFGNLPDGKYQVQIHITPSEGENIGINHSKNGRLQCTWELTVAGGEYINRKAWKRDGLDNEENIGWFKGGIKKLGVEPPSSSKDLPDVLAALEGTFAEVTIKTKAGSDFANVYFNKALDPSEVNTEGLEVVEDGGAEAEAEAEAEVPSETEVVEETQATETNGWNVGDKVQVQYDKDWYQGEITGLEDAEALVKFEDGQTLGVAYDKLVPFEPDAEVEEAPAPAPKPVAKPAAKAAPTSRTAPAPSKAAAPVAKTVAKPAAKAAPGKAPVPTKAPKAPVEVARTNITFTDEGMLDATISKINELGTAAGFSSDDYNTWSELLCDVAEFHSVSGTFKDAASLIKAVEAKVK